MSIHSPRIRVALSLGLLLAAQTAGADPLADNVAHERQVFLAAHPGYDKMGMQISIVRAGGTDQRIYSYGYTDTTNTTPVDASTRFLVNSVTKTFTAMLMAVMESKGLLPSGLSTTLPELMTYPQSGARTGSRNIQLLHLATHWGGLVRDPVASVTNKADLYSDVHDDTGAPNYTYCVDPSTSTYCQPPGLSETYSNWGYSVLGDILGDLYGYGGTVGHENDPPMWKDALSDYVNAPLGLSVTTSTGSVPTGAAKGYTNIANSPVQLEYSRTHDYRWPGGGLWLNARGAIIWLNTNLQNWGSVSGATPEIQAAEGNYLGWGWAQYGTAPLTTALQGLAWLFRHDTVTATVGGVTMPVWMMRKDGSGSGYYAYYVMVPRRDPTGDFQEVNGTNVGGYGVAIHTNFGDYGMGSTSTLEADVRQMAEDILTYLGGMPMN